MPPPATVPLDGFPPPKYVENTRLSVPEVPGLSLETKNALAPRREAWKVPALGAVGKSVELVIPMMYTKPLLSSVMPLAVSVRLPERYVEYFRLLPPGSNSLTNACVPGAVGV